MPAEVESMMYVGTPPWHGIGVPLDHPPTAAEAIAAAGLDWAVEKRPLFTPDGANGFDPTTLKPVTSHRAVIRTDDQRILGVVGCLWQPLQNREAFSFFDPFVAAGAAEYQTAGSLKGGRRVWVLAKVAGDPMEVARGDVVERYLLLSIGHDGTAAISVRFTPIRVVCWNTLTLAESDTENPFLKIVHRGNVAETLDKVQEVVDITRRTFAATIEQYRFLASRQAQNIERYVQNVLVRPEDRELWPKALPRIIELFEFGRGQDNPAIRGTWWAAYNAITQWVDHDRGRASSRLDEAWFGKGRRIKRRALEVATGFARAA